jgi:CRISPR-associated protein Cmr6
MDNRRSQQSKRTLIARQREDIEKLLVSHLGHPGLVFERYPKIFSINNEEVMIGADGRTDRLYHFIEYFENAGNGPARARLAELHNRLDTFIESTEHKHEFKTIWRLAVGLGNPDPSDIGFAFDHACGVPYLPGSTVKGIVRSGALLHGAEKEERAILLGDEPNPDKGDSGLRGGVVFFDALPKEWPELTVDVITRHHDPEGIAKKNALPLETDEPTPVPFLVVKKDQVFVFRIARLAQLQAPNFPDDWDSIIWKWLATALDELGAGAKTAVGYGQMRGI